MIVYTPNADVYFVGRDHSETDHLVVKETWVENVYRITEGALDDTGVLLDIGANIGAVSVYAARQGATVVAVEPEPENLSLLHTNLANNAAADAVTVLPAAVAAQRGTVRLQPGHGNSRLVDEDGGSAITVDAITLEDVYQRAGVPYCDVLKIDIEGQEYPALAAADRDVIRKARRITMEFDAVELSVFGDLVSRLACDYSIEILGSPQRGGYLYACRYDA